MALVGSFPGPTASEGAPAVLCVYGIADKEELANVPYIQLEVFGPIWLWQNPARIPNARTLHAIFISASFFRGIWPASTEPCRADHAIDNVQSMLALLARDYKSNCPLKCTEAIRSSAPVIQIIIWRTRGVKIPREAINRLWLPCRYETQEVALEARSSAPTSVYHAPSVRLPVVSLDPLS
jgi:hypothetical protein